MAAEIGGRAVHRALSISRSIAPAALLEDGTPKRGVITATVGPAGADDRNDGQGFPAVREPHPAATPGAVLE